MKEEKVSFSDFGKAFQEKLAKIMLLDRPFADQLFEVLDIGYFEFKYLQVFVRMLLNYKKEYKSHPSVEAIKTLIKTELRGTDALKEQVRTYFSSYFTTENDYQVEDDEFIKNKSLDFCRKQKLKEAMFKAVDLIQQSSFDDVATVINGALKLGSDLNFGHEYIEDFEDRFQVKIRDPLGTGWVRIDQITQGGLGRGELGVVIASTGCGKSFFLCHLGSAAVQRGKTVLHYTLELSETSIGARYDANISGVGLDMLQEMKEDVFEKIKDVPGKLIIKEYPTKSATLTTITNHIDRLIQRDIKPDLIIIDYADLIKFSDNYKEKRDSLQSIYEELRAIAQQYNVALWTASQTNRTGLDAEVVTMGAISEAFSKCFVADFIMTLSRTIDEKQTNKGKVFIAKSRLGVDGIVFPIYMNTAYARIKVLEPQTEEEKQEAQNDIEKLREVYLRHKKNGENKK